MGVEAKMNDDYDFRDPEPANEVVWARGRRVDRTYVHRTSTVKWVSSRDFGKPARYVVKVFDEGPDATVPEGGDLTKSIIQTSAGGRKQLTLQVAGTAGAVREIKIQRVPTASNAEKLENILTLDRDGSRRLIELVRALEYIPIEGDEDTVRLDDETIRLLFSDSGAADRLYRRTPDAYRSAIERDSTARDVMAVAHRQEVVDQFRRLMDNDDFFDSEAQTYKGKEKVWQKLFECEPWLLGVGLGGQLFTSWDSAKLEQVVAGFHIGSPGKRTDALMRTQGKVRSMVFAEIKHHRTALLASEPLPYRTGCWAPGKDLTGGVVQAQQTVYLATKQIGDSLPDKDCEGANTGESTYLVRPRSYLVIGHLSMLCGQNGNVNEDKLRSFELYRRSLQEPEIVTFDELLARAEWIVSNGAEEGKT